MPIVEQDIINILRTEKRPLKAKTIARILRTESGTEVSRTEVNRLLYAMKPRGVVSSAENNSWILSGEAKYDGKSDV
jgi:hypothetical protein